MDDLLVCYFCYEVFSWTRSYKQSCHSTEANFSRIWFRDLKFRILSLENKHLRAHNFLWRVFLSFIIISQLRQPIELKSHRFVILCMCGYTPSEKTGLWQLPIVSTVIKRMLSIVFALVLIHNISCHRLKILIASRKSNQGKVNHLMLCLDRKHDLPDTSSTHPQQKKA